MSMDTTFAMSGDIISNGLNEYVFLVPSIDRELIF